MSDAGPENVDEMLRLGIMATERGEYAAGLQLLSKVYQTVSPDKAPQGLSYFGLCMAQVERKHKAGADLCEKAIGLQFYEGKHWANLVRLYIAGKNRRKAVEVLEDALRKMRNDQALIRVQHEIGYRRAPYFRFLNRRNPFNKLYSVSAGRLKKRGLVILITLLSLAYIGVLIGVFFMILE